MDNATAATTALTISDLLALSAVEDTPAGVRIVVSGHPIKSENGTFCLYATHEGLAHKHPNGIRPTAYWKRINTRTGAWSPGGNTARNFKGENLDRLNALIAEGIVTIAAA